MPQTPEQVAATPYTEFVPKDALSHFDDGRQIVLEQIIKQIETSRDIDNLEKYCRSYLKRVLEHRPVAAQCSSSQ